MITETWLPILGYEGLYEVSDLGRVKSLPKEWVCGSGRKCSHNGKILSLTKSPEGYPQLRLWNNGKVKTHRVHTLMAEAFLSNPSGYKCVNHKDSNRANNILSNLEWVSHSGNRIHALKFGYAKSGDYSPNSKMSDSDIIRIINYPLSTSSRNIAQQFKVSESLVSLIRTGKYRRAKRILNEINERL